MITPIHTSKKLAVLINKLIVNHKIEESGILGKWNATVFYVNRKKCWLITNALTQYNVILTDIKTADLESIGTIFKNSLYTQLIFDGIIIDIDYLEGIIGDLMFLPTDNDRKTTGFQNHRLADLEFWKFEYERLENMPIKDLANRINKCPILLGKSKRMSDYTNSISEIRKILTP